MVLLDTCTLLWLIAYQENLSANAKKAISNSEQVFVSAISNFELGLKIKKNIIEIAQPLQQWWQKALQLHGLQELPITSIIAGLSTELPDLHRDPADRFIIATAMQNSLTILTPDSHIHAYPNVKVVW